MAKVRLRAELEECKAKIATNVSRRTYNMQRLFCHLPCTKVVWGRDISAAGRVSVQHRKVIDNMTLGRGGSSSGRNITVS